MTMHARLLAPVVVLALLGCRSTQPPRAGETTLRSQVGDVDVWLTHESTSSLHVLEASRDAVWSALREVYEALDVPISTSDPTSGQMGNPSFEARRLAGDRLSRFLNCGSGITGQPYADSYRVTLSLLSRVESTDSGTVIRTLLDAEAQARGPASYPVQCQSRGTLENLIAERVAELAG